MFCALSNFYPVVLAFIGDSCLNRLFLLWFLLNYVLGISFLLHLFTINILEIDTSSVLFFFKSSWPFKNIFLTYMFISFISLCMIKLAILFMCVIIPTSNLFGSDFSIYCSFVCLVVLDYELNFLGTLSESLLCLFPGIFGNSKCSTFQLPTSRHFTLNSLLKFFRPFSNVNLGYRTQEGWFIVENF